LTIEKRKTGPAVWVYRWRENTPSGSRTKRKQIVGATDALKTRTEAERAVAGLRLDINAQHGSCSNRNLSEVTEHYRLTELQPSDKTVRTKDTYNCYLDRIILPKWGNHHLTEIKAVAVERWLAEIDGAPATKVKARALMNILFRHAMRYEWTQYNPIALVRQSAKRQKEPIVLDTAEVLSLLEELKKQIEPCRTLVYVAVVTGLRRGELFGLKWGDVDFEKGVLRISRSLVNGIEGSPKTATSCRPVPLTSDLAAVLDRWRGMTLYTTDEDWVFASPQALGRRPYWPDSMMYKHIRPAAEAVGIQKQIGWHSFRRTTATMLLSSGASIRTTQELLRHASPSMTLGTYAQAPSADRQAAQIALSALIASPASPSGPTMVQ